MCPGRPEDPRWALFLTCVVSHLPMIVTLKVLHSRRLFYETTFATFAVISSFLYHVCECLDISLILKELHWHRIDNICAINCIFVTGVHISGIRDIMVESYVKFIGLAIIMIFQEQSPWNVNYTVIPVLLSIALPIVYRTFRRKGVRGINLNPLCTATCFFLIAMCFFWIGLDDMNDPFRIFHGGFHFFIAVSVYFFWQAIPPSMTMLNANSPLRKLRREANAPNSYVIVEA